jgi:hypothetical protein
VRLYIEGHIKGNPNAAKIRELAESCKTKGEADALIEKFSIATKSAEDYNSIRSRLEGVKEKHPNLVENHLTESGLNKPAPKDGIVEGVESELEDLFPGSNLSEVRSLANM